jgi:hypothetical protein
VHVDESKRDKRRGEEAGDSDPVSLFARCSRVSSAPFGGSGCLGGASIFFLFSPSCLDGFAATELPLLPPSAAESLCTCFQTGTCARGEGVGADRDHEQTLLDFWSFFILSRSASASASSSALRFYESESEEGEGGSERGGLFGWTLV